jgi:hypothetical protein
MAVESEVEGPVEDPFEGEDKEEVISRFESLQRKLKGNT